ncbi:MAG: hypothetical protein PHV11_10115 [Candidatus Bipolaricaulis sp.]|nr:hypothetical protein [Candidatus Bipolaricaulis sp.]
MNSTESGIYLIIGLYLLTGIVALGILDLLTGRIRRKLGVASLDTQSKLASQGSYTGSRGALALTIIALLVFWPVAIYGALSKSRSGGKQ